MLAKAHSWPFIVEHPHFTVGDTEAQRENVLPLRSLSESVVGLGLESYHCKFNLTAISESFLEPP